MKYIRSHRAVRRGFVLLAVLWVMVGVSTLGLGLALIARRAAGSARNRREIIEGMWAAEDCLNRAEAVIAAVLTGHAADVGIDSNSGALSWSALDRAMSASPLLGGTRCTAALKPTGTTIDVNAADEELLTRLLLTIGEPPARANSLVDALLDWRDPDDLPRPHGAEEAWYIGHGRAPPRNGPLADIRELARVRGFECLSGIDSLLGVEPGRIILDRALLPVIAALPGLTDEAVARVAEDRVRGVHIADLLAFSAQLSPDARAALVAQYADLIRLTTSEPDAWILTARATTGAPAVTTVIEVRLVRAGDRAAIVRRRMWVE